MPNVHKDLSGYYPGANQKAKVKAVRDLQLKNAARPKKTPPVAKKHQNRL